MELSNSHREALLDALEAAQKDKQVAKACLKTADDFLPIQQGFEVSEWLADTRIEQIKKALIDNELFNY